MSIIVPLELHGMVRSCHPLTPHVGLHRQSGDPEVTKQYYKKARQKRDLVCFPFMLRQMTHLSLGYRFIRQLWITVIQKILMINLYKTFLVKKVLDYLSCEQIEQIPLFYSKHMEENMHYEPLFIEIRMKQLAGRFVSLGYSPLSISIPDYEYEEYLILCNDSEKNKITLLYHELKKRDIINKRPILLSHINNPRMRLFDWTHYCKVNRLTLYLNLCIRENKLSQEEILLLKSWVHYMKYPNR